jgi:quinol monooxygenase YgiN
MAGAALTGAAAWPAFLVPERRTTMYGLIGKMTATPGQRDALATILLEGTGGMPGCLSYVVATDPTEPDALWITEVWDSAESHKASLALPGVQAAIAKGRPLIAGFGSRVETAPIGGHGLASGRAP